MKFTGFIKIIAEKVVRQQIIIGSILWVLTLEFFAAQAVTQAACTTPYNVIDNTISELGITASGVVLVGKSFLHVNSPLHEVMNLSFVVTGLLMLLGLYFTRKAWSRQRMTCWGWTFFTIAGIGKIIVGLAPGDINFVLHALGGLGMVGANIGVIFLGLAISSKEHRWLGIFSLFLGFLGLIGLLLFIGYGFIGWGGGVAERLLDYPVFGWMVVMGIYLLRRSKSLILEQLC